MHIDIGEDLSHKLRALADKAQKRIWVAVPYIGGWNAVKSVLGLRWRDSDAVSFRLLTDVGNKGWLDRETVSIMNDHGKIKTLAKLHAKVYIVDDRVLITSANLTEMAFARRYEVGIFLSPEESTAAISAFKSWWNKAQFPPTGWIKALSKTSGSSSKKEEPAGSTGTPTKLFHLPTPPLDAGRSDPRFRDYKAFQTAYRDFADVYAANRLWPHVPLYLETDMFLNYLFRDAKGKPSQKYKKTKTSRNLSEVQQRALISKYTKEFKQWASSNGGDNHINARRQRSNTAKQLLQKNRIASITRADVKTVTHTLNCMRVYDINATKFLNPKNNRLETIRTEWEFLLHETDIPVEVRMTHCYDRLAGFGQSAVQELLGWFDPKKYPIRNSNSNAGLRFLGF